MVAVRHLCEVNTTQTIMLQKNLKLVIVIFVSFRLCCLKRIHQIKK